MMDNEGLMQEGMCKSEQVHRTKLEKPARDRLIVAHNVIGTAKAAHSCDRNPERRRRLR